MKRLSPQQIQNMLFTVIVALAALSIYLLTGRSGGVADAPAPTPLQTEAADELRFAPVPGTVFSDLVTGTTDFLAKVGGDDPFKLYLQSGGAKTGRAALSYTVDDDGYVSSFTLSFQMKDKPVAKPKTDAEKAYAEEYAAFVAKQNVAIRTILAGVVAACDLNDVLLTPVVLQWYAGAVGARDDGKKYEDAYRGCTFLAFPMQAGGETELVCSLIAH